jgi:hypothetical protein
MKTYRNRLLAIAIFGLAALCVAALPAASQAPVSGGKFALPYAVKWHEATLPAGEYSFRLQSSALPAIIEVRGPNGTQMIMATAIDRKERTEESSMTIEWHGEQPFVRDLNIGHLGLQVIYSVPKASESDLLAQAPKIEKLPVTLSGN